MKSLLVIYVVFTSSWSPPQLDYIPFPTYEDCLAYQKDISSDLGYQFRNNRIKEYHTSCSQIRYPSAKVDDK